MIMKYITILFLMLSQIIVLGDKPPIDRSSVAVLYNSNINQGAFEKTF